MDENRFWVLIEDASKKALKREEMAEILEDVLCNLPATDIVEFERNLANHLRLTHRYDIWAVAYIIQHGCSDDGFMDFRAWMISQGRQFVNEALEAPSSIADHVDRPQVLRLESLLYVAINAYERTTGNEMPDEFVPFYDNTPCAIGERWLPAQLPSMYPDLCAKFGYEPKDGV